MSIDPRVLRTQALLKSAALELMKQGIPSNQLTVHGITKQAKLNRTTFYLHYEDAAHLVHSLMEEIKEQLTTKMLQLIDGYDRDENKPLIKVLQFLYGERDHLLFLFNVEQFEHHIYMLFRTVIEERRIMVTKPSKNLEINIDIKTASLVGIVMWWLKNGQHYSADYIAEQIHKMYRS